MSISDKFAEVAATMAYENISKSEINHLMETAHILNSFSNLNMEGITNRQPYFRINNSSISENAREYLLGFNSLYQISFDFYKSKLKLSELPLELTEIQKNMPEEYLAKCGFSNLNFRIGGIPRTSEKGKLNMRLIGGFFGKDVGGFSFRELSEKIKEIPLSEDYANHFDNFHGILNVYSSAFLFGSFFDSLIN